MGQCLGRRSKDAQAGPGAGNKALERALLVGVSYLSQRAELCDSASDAAFLAEWLWTSEFAAQHHSVRLLAEDGKAHGLPTRHEILQGIKWLVSGAVEGSSLFFFFSGHGITPPYNPDGRCSLCPCDCATQGAITPADLAGAIGQLPAGVLLTLLIDIAHSGCPFRLPYSRTVEWTRAAERLVEVKTTGPGGEPESEDSEDGDSDPGETEMVSAGAQINVISCQCIHDADAPDSASAGAMTHAFAAAADVAMHPTGTADTDTLLRGIYSRLRSRRLDQVPRVQSTHDVRTLSLNPNPLAFWMQECRPEQPERTWWLDTAKNQRQWEAPRGRSDGDLGKPRVGSVAPPPWRQYRATDGRLYYHEPQTGETRWQPPPNVDVTPAPPLDARVDATQSTLSDAPPRTRLTPNSARSHILTPPSDAPLRRSSRGSRTTRVTVKCPPLPSREGTEDSGQAKEPAGAVEESCAPAPASLPAPSVYAPAPALAVPPRPVGYSRPLPPLPPPPPPPPPRAPSVPPKPPQPHRHLLSPSRGTLWNPYGVRP
eukprot:TRINITY_DN4626_c2_g1_i3.p1 TRINITY_DN4626_c2_g1~~TRINITY_DN4626_c2_g1_i3.p1  ORF type:complete len:541 (+),score=129.54 TRINITY_DN4626_c2_g1_i3:70-1692(+)